MATTEKPSGAVARAFDIRTFIAALMGIYGVVLLVTGLVATSEDDLAKADGLNVNLWVGLGLILTAAIMQGWAMLRPVVVKKKPDADSGPETHES